MNRDDCQRVLAKRAQLTRVGYVDATIDAWTEALGDVSEHDANRAIIDLAAHGATSIAVPEIRNWLRLEQRRRESLEQAKPAQHECACDRLTICDMHRRIGIDAIAHIRATRKAAP